MLRTELNCDTRGRGLHEMTPAINEWLGHSAFDDGLVLVFLCHTSASLILCENADPDVPRDLEDYFERLVRDGDSRFVHRAEGPDDMSAHIRTVLTGNSLTLPVKAGRLDLGTWQGVFVWEHRYQAHRRRLSVTAWS